MSYVVALDVSRCRFIALDSPTIPRIAAHYTVDLFNASA
jgi:hypothetical protein